MAPIDHLSINSPSKTLGSMTCPSGSSEGAFTPMREKAQGWVNRAIVGKLNRQQVWFLLDHQLYPMVFFGISSVTAPFDALSKCLQQQWREILPCGGVRQTLPRILRQLDSGLYSFGLPLPGGECFLAQMTKLLAHYDNKSGVGIYVQMSIELLVAKLGVSLQPLAQSYPLYHDQVTSCWLKSFWEKAHLFKIHVELAPLPLQFPWERDRWLMEYFRALEFNWDELIRLSRFKSHQQVYSCLTFLTPAKRPSTSDTCAGAGLTRFGLLSHSHKSTLPLAF
jgi:hypothetical protein